MRPLGKFHFCYAHRFYPVHFLWFHGAGEGILLGFDFVQNLRDLLKRRLREAGTGIAHVHQLLLVVIESEYQSAKMLPRAVGIGVAADHAVRSLCDLDFQTFAGAALFVAAIALLGDDAFKPFLIGRVEQR